MEYRGMRGAKLQDDCHFPPEALNFLNIGGISVVFAGRSGRPGPVEKGRDPPKTGDRGAKFVENIKLIIKIFQVQIILALYLYFHNY